jgi:hypothetical protein
VANTRDLRIQFGSELFRQFEGVVRYGPFKGMKLAAQSSWSPSDACPKLLGTYEREAVDTITRLLEPHKTFVDVGAADGYFAIGFLVAGLCRNAVAFEVNPHGQRIIKEMAAANGVADRLMVLDKADELFPEMLLGNGVSIADCVTLIDVEGGEFSILHDRTLSALAAAPMVIELHGRLTPDAAPLEANLLSRLRRTFDVEIITTGSRRFDCFPEFATRTDDERWLMAGEGRPYLMDWAVCRPPRQFRGRKVAIVSAADDAFAELAFGLHESLGRWRSAFRLIDIGLCEAAKQEAARRGIEIISTPAGFFGDTQFVLPYLRAMYLRPRLPKLVDADLILWMDSDCWVQQQKAIERYFEGAIAFPDAFTICTFLDVDYPRCIDGYTAYQNAYHTVHEQLFGRIEADALYGNAIFSSGVFCADRNAPVWTEWWAEAQRLYETNEYVRTIKDTGHIAEQQALNRVLHRTRAYNRLTSDMNWHCHCSEVMREDGVVKILPSRRVPAIVHLSTFRVRADEYRSKRLLYEPPDPASSARSL